MENLHRYFLDLSYLGTQYNGWQKQPNAIGIQQVLEEKLSILLRSPIETLASGRTDTGVHAISNVVHFDTPIDLDTQKFLFNLNALLPSDIVAKSVLPVVNTAHARFDAISRTYFYRISKKKNPFLQGQYGYYPIDLDIVKMNYASSYLLGRQDFTTFSKSKMNVNNHFCEIKEIEFEQVDSIIHFRIKGNRFLRGMVRLILGTLIEVGKGKITSDDFQSILFSMDRKNAATTAQCEGLFLENIEYPNSVYLANNS